MGTLLGRRSRPRPPSPGLALLAGSVLQRFGVFAAGVASTRDPRYVVAPQRERLAASRGPDAAVTGGPALHTPDVDLRAPSMG